VREQQDTLVIRAMKEEDIDDVVRIHCCGFEASRSTRLGKPFLRKMYDWYLAKNPKLCFVAEAENRVAGFVTGSIGGSSHRIFRYAAAEILLAFVLHPQLLLQADMYEQWLGYLRSLFRRKRGAAQADAAELPVKATLDSIAVDPEVRGRNIGGELVRRFEEAASELGVGVLRLGVEYDNSVARRFYEKCGWSLEQENPDVNSANYIKRLKK